MVAYIADGRSVRVMITLRYPALRCDAILTRQKKRVSISEDPFRDPAGTRTQDPIIKSDVLYQLSYEINLSLPLSVLGVQKYRKHVCKPKKNQLLLKRFKTGNKLNSFARFTLIFSIVHF